LIQTVTFVTDTDNGDIRLTRAAGRPCRAIRRAKPDGLHRIV